MEKPHRRLTAFLIVVNGLAWEMEPSFLPGTEIRPLSGWFQDDKDGVYLAWQEKRMAIWINMPSIIPMEIKNDGEKMGFLSALTLNVNNIL